jgi:hypothetical protein
LDPEVIKQVFVSLLFILDRKEPPDGSSRIRRQAGLFPRAPEAVAGILRHLRIPDLPPDSRFKVEELNILDPCAGEAQALAQIAEGFGISKGHVYAVELNARRAVVIAESQFDNQNPE